MKKIALIFLVCFTAWAICSCNQQKPTKKEHENEELNAGGYATRSPYFFTGILKPKVLKVRACNGNGYGLEKSNFTALLFLLSGDSYRQYSEATFEEFERLANKIGDTKSEEGYSHATPADNQTTESAILGVTIKSLSHYDDAHPEGSSLKDIVRINYMSFDHVFNKTLKPTRFGSEHHAMYSVGPTDDLTKITHPALIAGTYAGRTGYNDGLVMSVEFLQPPAIATQQLQVTIQFENGVELTDDITVDIVEVN